MLGSIWLFYNNLVVMIRLFFVLACEWNGHKNVFYFVFMRNISVARTNTAACRRVDEGCNGLLATCFAAMGAHFRWVANYRKVKQRPGVAGLQYGTCYLRRDQLIALFRDRYFEILAYLLTVLAEILRPQRKPLCGGKDPLKGGDQLIACFAIAILKSWRIC